MRLLLRFMGCFLFVLVLLPLALYMPLRPWKLFKNGWSHKYNNLLSLSFLFVGAEPAEHDPSSQQQQQQEQQQKQQSIMDTLTKQAYSYGIGSSGTSASAASTSSAASTGTAGGTPPAASMDSSTHHSTKSILVTIPSLGKIQGKRDHGIDFYGGIPYAAPPVGQLRFAPPEPPPPWSPVVLDGTHFGADCWQLMDPVTNPGARRDYMSEDCLSLNVFTPAGHAKKVQTHGVGGLLFQHSSSSASSSSDSSSKKIHHDKLLPVMVWLHGGAFQQGGARRPEYDGRRLAERDVLVVTLNYRLGALGFLVSSTDGVYGNFGLMDQRAALQFIHDNIIHFGGDPMRVTLFGESAGAVMTGQHLMMEGAGTLFQSAILQSSPLGYTFRSVVVADFIGEALKRSVDCRDLECLRAERVEEIMRAQSSLMGIPRSVGDFFTWGPTLTQERNLHVGGGSSSSSFTSSSSGSTSSFPFGTTSDRYQSSAPSSKSSTDGLLLDWEDYQRHKRRRGRGDRVRDAYDVNVTQPLKHTHLIPDNIPIIIGSNQHEGEIFVHSAFPITMSKPGNFPWCLLSLCYALFRLS
jgi:carboxylesterase type B